MKNHCLWINTVGCHCSWTLSEILVFTNNSTLPLGPIWTLSTFNLRPPWPNFASYKLLKIPQVPHKGWRNRFIPFYTYTCRYPIKRGTKWLAYFSTFGHLHQWKLAQWNIKFAKIGPRFSQVVNKPSKIAQDFKDFAKMAIILVTLTIALVLLRIILKCNLLNVYLAINQVNDTQSFV